MFKFSKSNFDPDINKINSRLNFLKIFYFRTFAKVCQIALQTSKSKVPYEAIDIIKIPFLSRLLKSQTPVNSFHLGFLNKNCSSNLILYHPKTKLDHTLK